MKPKISLRLSNKVSHDPGTLELKAWNSARKDDSIQNVSHVVHATTLLMTCQNPESGMPSTTAFGLSAVIQSFIASMCKNVASPPAESPPIRT